MLHVSPAKETRMTGGTPFSKWGTVLNGARFTLVETGQNRGLRGRLNLEQLAASPGCDEHQLETG